MKDWERFWLVGGFNPLQPPSIPSIFLTRDFWIKCSVPRLEVLSVRANRPSTTQLAMIPMAIAPIAVTPTLGPGSASDGNHLCLITGVVRLLTPVHCKGSFNKPLPFFLLQQSTGFCFFRKGKFYLFQAQYIKVIHRLEIFPTSVGMTHSLNRVWYISFHTNDCQC